MTPIFILGTSGHAREVADIVDALGRRPIFVTHEPAILEGWADADEIMLETDAVRMTGEDFAIGIGENAVRARLAQRYASQLNFPSLIHPDASFGRGQRDAIAARKGVVVFPGARLTNGVAVGDFCNINLNASVSHDCELGDFVTLAPNAAVAGNVRIGAGAWIGLGAAVNQGTAAKKLSIGERTVIGSGAVVTNDCAPDSVYVGVPARKIR